MKNKLIITTLAAMLNLTGFTNEATAGFAFSEKGAQALTQRETPPTPAQEAWWKATDYERKKMAEQIGEDGARRLARSKGWVPLLEEGKKTVPQGPDHIYRGKNGIVHVVEAKGGSGQLGHAYGYPQGSSEWAVKSAERIVTSRTATELEKKAAKEVLAAAAKGKLEVHVIRTSHTYGEPTKVAFEQTVKCTKQAYQLAASSLEKMARGSATASRSALASSRNLERGFASEVKGAARASSQTAKATGTAARTACKIAGKAAKIAGPAGLVLEVGVRTSDVIETERRFDAGEITAEERRVSHGKNAGGMVGGMAGTAGGAAAGAAIGTPFGGIGAIPGATIGGLVGAIAGGFAGDKVGSTIGGALAR
jgi:hypothetical protein